ncbi:MAG: PfkB family carbohydrate kinase [Actinomycetota bacterium]
MTGPAVSRLLHLGTVVVDIVLDVAALPERGGDVLATRTRLTAGGGFNVMAAAARQGLPVAYAGAHGTGPFADLALAGLAGLGAAVLLPPVTGTDTGFVVAMVDSSGERTFVTSPGAEAMLTSADLAGLSAGPRDAVYLSGYALLHPANRAALLGWLPRLDDASLLVVDPGPLGHEVPAAALIQVLCRADWWTCNAREATALTGCGDPADAARALAGWTGRRGVLVRTGSSGCLLASRDEAPVPVPGFLAQVVDTSGAGDTHTGTFVAALGAGAGATSAARTANAAAALSVTRRGPATAPTAAELALFLASR